MAQDNDTPSVKRPPPYVAPARHLEAYHCPFCGVYAKQYQYLKGLYAQGPGSGGRSFAESDQFGAHHCTHCNHMSLWYGDALMYPAGTKAPFASADMPADVANDFNEARTVLPHSPRSAAALLRLALQKLMPHLAQTGKDLNADIGALVNQGLPVLVQRSLDALRVIGNNAVHPGVLDLRDDDATALSLFHLLNLIIEEQITKPKTVQAVYDSLPQSALEAIKQRDAKAKPAATKPK